MGRNKKYGNIILKDGDREILKKIARSQTAEYRKVQRAKIILYSTDAMSNAKIAQTIGVYHNTVANFVNKYIAVGLDYAMNDAAQSGKHKCFEDDVKSQIKEYCRKELPEYMQPTEIVFLNALPLTPIGKVDYRELERMAGIT